MTDESGAPTPRPELFAQPVEALLRRTAARDPVAGGGPMAVLAASAAAALVVMSARFATDEWGGPIVAEVEPWLDELAALADEDGAGFEALLAAQRLPADDPERPAAVDTAVRRACAVPLRVCEIGARLVDHAARLADEGRPALVGDAHTGLRLAAAAVESAAELVRLNAGDGTAPELVSRADELVAEIERVRRRPG